jgi:hypothetical protein
MSIWTDLLVLHGHVTTPAALALLAPASGCIAGRPAAPAGSAAGAVDRAAAPAAQVSEPTCHPLRAVGQLQ